jgi:hypothetical protein
MVALLEGHSYMGQSTCYTNRTDDVLSTLSCRPLALAEPEG